MVRSSLFNSARNMPISRLTKGDNKSVLIGPARGPIPAGQSHDNALQLHDFNCFYVSEIYIAPGLAQHAMRRT